jgi:hypothetical protein
LRDYFHDDQRITKARKCPPAASGRRGPSKNFIVRDANGQALAYVYYEEEPRQGSAAKLLGDVRGNASDVWNFRPQLPRKGTQAGSPTVAGVLVVLPKSTAKA